MESLTILPRAIRARGASTVEFALLIAAVVLGSAAGVRALGHSTAHAAGDAITALGGSGHESRVVYLPPATTERSVRH